MPLQDGLPAAAVGPRGNSFTRTFPIADTQVFFLWGKYRGVVGRGRKAKGRISKKLAAPQKELSQVKVRGLQAGPWGRELWRDGYGTRLLFSSGAEAITSLSPQETQWRA